MGFFMQKHRNKIVLFIVVGGGLILLYSFRKLPFLCVKVNCVCSSEALQSI